MANEPLFTFGTKLGRMDTRKEVKLQLPLRTHVRLRAAKLLRGETIAATVVAAVAWYFEQHPIADAGQDLGPAMLP